MRIAFPGGVQVDALFAGHTVHTDQPLAAEGEGLAPSPFELFIASLGTCAGYYVLAFCRKRGIATEGIDLALRTEAGEGGKGVSRIAIDIHLPSSFPARYVDACVRAAEQCTVKRHLAAPPEIALSAVRV
jgi:ribosomal protein S12 methylthiotransferase accessory factor